MDVEESLHQKPHEVCITEDTESIDLEWFENTKLNRVKNGIRCLLQVGVRDWESLATSPSMIQKGVCETVAEVMDAEVEREDEMHPSKRPRVVDRVHIHVPPQVEPKNRDFDMNEFLRSCPNPVVSSVLGDSEIIRRAAVRGGYPVMKSRFLNFGDDVHDQWVRVRITATVQRIQPRLLILVFPSRVWSPILNYATSPRVREWSDRERKAELAILYWVVSLGEIQETAGNMFLVENPVGATSGNQHSIQRVRNAPSVFEDISHLCMFGVKDPQSHQETRQVLDKQSRAVKICRSTVPEQTCSRTGERSHECVSGFCSLAHAHLGTSSD